MIYSSKLGKTLEIRYRKCFFEGYSIKKEQFRKIFNVKTSKKSKEEEFGVAGAGSWDERVNGLDPIQYDTIDEEYERLYVHKEYTKGLKVERKWIDDEQYGVGDKIAKSIGRGGKILVEQTAADVLNNGFTTNGYDGVPLFSESHPIKRPASAGQVGDNLLTSAELKESNLKLALLLLQHQVAPEGFEIECEATDLIVPTDLQFVAAVLLSSTNIPGSDHNDSNVLKSIVQLITYKWLTSATSWFVRDKELNELNFFWRVKPEFAKDKEFDTMALKYRGYMRFSVGYSNWRGWVGCQQ